MTPGLVKGLLEREEVKMLGASPSLIEGVWQAQGGREVLRGLETVSYSGGPLAGAVGEGLSKEGVHVVAGCKFPLLLLFVGGREIYVLIMMI